MFLYYAREKGKLSCKSTGLHLLYDPRGPSVGRVDLPEYDFIKDGKINFGATIRALIFEQLAKMIYHQMRANLRCSLIHILLY